MTEDIVFWYLKRKDKQFTSTLNTWEILFI